ncbi:hypothetical protein GQX73_g8103 [Xylaria multiplex]|uniref:Uncharacterized protein n=1 Tax=Xylaria multiplex TaxID=323545 RepID=A0A7C8MQ34_9PEZI|nr:hypothetical protein GQX73_g8103 [Xylaria multiplex]
MPWAINPVFGQKLVPKCLSEPVANPEPANLEAAQADGGDADRNGSPVLEPKHSDQSKLRPPSDRLTLYQFFYIFFGGIGSAIVAGAINFAVAYGLYGMVNDTSKPPIRLFQFPSTLAGDTVVTLLIQFITTWILDSLLINRDLNRGGVQPIGFIREPKLRLLRWFMFLDQKEKTYKSRRVKLWLMYLYLHTTRPLILAILAFAGVFGLSLGILTILGNQQAGHWDWYYSSRWTPEIFKTIQGAVLGLLFTPLVIIFWLCKFGWALKTTEQQPSTE